MTWIVPPLLLALLAAHPAAAQERPVVFPTRDAAITYRLPNEGGEMRVSWLAARRLMRTELPGGLGFGVMDLASGSGFMAMTRERLVMDLPRGQFEGRSLAPSERARFTREGQDRVANTACTVWRVEDQGESSRVCMTADGVALRAESLGRPDSRLEALRVDYGPQDPARFERPRGYQSLPLPSGAGGLPRGTALPPPGLTLPPR